MQALNGSSTDANEGDTVKGASILFGPSFIAIYSESGGHVGVMDRDSFYVCLPPQTGRDEVARNVLLALDASHAWSKNKWLESGGFRGAEERRKSWIQEMFAKFPQFKKSKGKLFDDLAWLHVKLKGDVYSFIPKSRMKLDGYGFIVEGGRTVCISADLNSPDFNFEESLYVGMRMCVA